jgi:hypothetical protein
MVSKITTGNFTFEMLHSNLDGTSSFTAKDLVTDLSLVPGQDCMESRFAVKDGKKII